MEKLNIKRKTVMLKFIKKQETKRRVSRSPKFVDVFLIIPKSARVNWQGHLGDRKGRTCPHIR